MHKSIRPPRRSGVTVFFSVFLLCLLVGLHAGAPPEPLFQSSFEEGETLPPPEPVGCESVAGRDVDGDGLIDPACIHESYSPDPAQIAPQLDPTVPADFGNAVEFLHVMPFPVQHGMLPGVIKKHSVSVLRGQVHDENGDPAEGVLVRVLNHPEYGYTFTRADGLFDIVVNGGAEVVLDYHKPGYLRAQRSAVAPWRDWEWVQDATLVPLDTVATTVVLGAHAPPQIIRSSVIQDEDGTREAILLAPAGLNAALRGHNEQLTPMAQLTVRATEYTVGERGPQRMPAALPPSVAYTYAVEFSADEAIAANARSVEFDRPLGFYLDNFLGFPVGTVIPAGAYDSRLASWLPADNGRVVKIISIQNGQADLDVDGSGAPADAAALQALGISQTEQRQLAALYPAGKELWRAPVAHFTPWDFNFPYVPNPDDEPPPDQGGEDPDDDPQPDDPPPDDPPLEGEPESDEPRHDDVDEDNEEECGSLIRCEEGSLTESISIPGTGMALVYSSKRAPWETAMHKKLRIRLTASTVPERLKKIELNVYVLGARYSASYDQFEPDMFFEQGLGTRDAYGRRWNGTVHFRAKLEYMYPLVYMGGDREGFQREWARFAATGNQIQRSSAHAFYYAISKGWDSRLSNVAGKVAPAHWDASGLGFGAWSLSQHHVLDRDRQVIYLGDGAEQRLGLPNPQGGGVTAQALIKQYGPHDLQGAKAFASTPGGNLQVLAKAEGEPHPGSSAIWQHDFSGGSRMLVDLCDAQALSCTDSQWGYVGPEMPSRLTIDSRGQTYVIAGPYIIEVSPDGSSQKRFDARTLAPACTPHDLAAWADRVFFTCGEQVFTLWRDGQVTHLAGGGDQVGDDVPPENHRFGSLTGIAVDSEGSLFILDSSHYKLYRIRSNGRVELAAGNGTWGTPIEEGGLATAQSLGNPKTLVMSGNGTPLLHYHFPDYRIREIKKNGRIFTIAGGGTQSIGSLDQGQSLSMSLQILAEDIGVLPDGSIAFLSEGRGSRSTIGAIVNSAAVAFDGYGALPRDIEKFISRDGREEYHFDSAGHHLATYDTLTGALKIAFEYNVEGYITAATDAYGNRTVFTRNADQQVTRITAPDGQQLTLEYDSKGRLSRSADPLARSWQMEYLRESGLLTRFAKPRGHASTFTWDTGRLTSDINAEGGGWTLARSRWTQWDRYQSRLTSAEGRVNTYNVDNDASGNQRRWTSRAANTGHYTAIKANGNIETKYRNGVTVEKAMAPDPRHGWSAPFSKQTVTSIDRVSNIHGQLSLVATHEREALFAGTTAAGTNVYDLDFKTWVNDRLYRSTYDAGTRTWQSITPENRRQTTRLNAAGRPVERRVDGLEPVHYAYDDRGRLSSITAGHGAEQRQVRIDYDANGWPYRVTDPEGRILLREHDVIGRLNTRILPDGRQIEFSYDENSNLVGLKPPGRAEHGFDYDRIDRLSRYTAPAVPAAGNGATEYSYNLDNQLTQTQRPDGRQINLGYRAETGLLEKIGSTTQPERQIGVDGYGRWWGAGAPTGFHETRALWAGPLMIRQETSNRSDSPHGAVKRVNYRYDNNLNLVSLQASPPPHLWANYNYDRDGLLTRLSFGHQILNYTNSPANGLLTAASVSSLSESWAYNGFAEPVAYQAHVSGSPHLGFAYTRDKLGRITAITETTAAGSQNTAYQYDLAGRLVGVMQNGQTIAEYAYDENSNRISAQYSGHLASALGACAPASGAITAQIDAQDRLLNYGTCNYAYGANGELQSKTDNGEITSYQYDEFGNLRQVTLPDGRELSYAIDGLNRRIGKYIDGQLQGTWLYKDQLNPVAELDAAGQVVSIFAYGEKSHVPSLMHKNGQTYRFITDHLGSVRQVVHVDSGQVVQALRYDAWGNVLHDSNPGFQPFGYAGGLYDRDTGLVRFGARDYDPITGRWTAKDPIGFGGGDSNLYAYVGGDPINRVDVTGNSQEDVGRIYRAYREVVDQMTRDGERIPLSIINNTFSENRDDDSLWPQAISGILNSIFRDGRSTIICGQQWERVKTKLESLELDDDWNFIDLYTDWHSYGGAESSNPNDPGLIIDPWKDTFSIINGPIR